MPGYARIWAVAAAVVVSVAACTGSTDGHDPTSTPRPPTSSAAISVTPSPTPTLSAEQQAAMTAYLGFEAETVRAERSPQTANISSLMKYGLDPAVGTVGKDITQYQIQGLAFRGTAPTPRAKVLGVDLNGKPAPYAVIYNCPTSPPDWKIYVLATGKPVQLLPNKVAEPFAITARVELVGGHWYVRSFKVDSKVTCHA